MMDPFDCSAPQFVPNLRDAADNLEGDGADEFFDISQSSFENKENILMTPKNKQPPLKEQFYTPMVVDDAINREDSDDEPEKAAETAETAEPESELAEPLAAVELTGTESSVAADQGESAIGNSAEPEQEQRMMKEAKRRSTGSNARKVRVFDGIELPREKNHQMTTRQDEPPRRALKRKISQMPSTSNVPDVKKTRPSLIPKNKYLSMAEMILRFQKDTPPRYRSRPSTASNDKSRLKITMAQSPKLVTKLRSRIPVEAEAEGNPPQFSAKPVDKNVFKKPVLRKPPVRPSTVPEPFHLTETKAKVAAPKEGVFVFKARPAPKTADMSNIDPNTSLESILSAKSTSTKYQGIKTVKTTNKETVPKPFSFEERDRKRKEEKEAKIKKMVEEETKIPRFHAKPAPSRKNESKN